VAQSRRATEPRDLLRQLTKGPALPAYLLYGDESYLVERAADAILKRLGGAQGSVRVRAGDDRLSDRVQEALRTGSLFGGAPIVMVQGVDALREDEQDALLALIPADPSAHLLLIGTAPDLRRRLYATCVRQGWGFEFGRLPVSRVPAWLREEAAVRGHPLTSDAAQLLVELVGPDLRLAANEMEKLSLYVGAGNPIDADAVGAVVGSLRTRSMLELADSLQRRSVGPAVALLRQLVTQGSHPIAIVAFMAGQIRRMTAARSLLRAGCSSEEVGRRLGMSSWVAERVCEGARRFESATLRSALAELAGIDLTLKSSRLPAQVVLESWLLDLRSTRARGT
jgi:DNA polymerase-3 subunit delta